MKNIREIITDLNVARSNSCSQEKSEEIKKIINDLLPHEKQEKALEIIKERFGSFILTMIENDLRTTKEQRELLKEVLYAKGD